jgi:vesicle coat complex subunit
MTIGYLATSLFCGRNHDLLLLTVSSMQKDLSSNDPLYISIALTAACKIVSKDTIPALLQLVLQCLDHKRFVVYMSHSIN